VLGFSLSWLFRDLYFFITTVPIGIATGYVFYRTTFLTRLAIVIVAICVDCLVDLIYILANSRWPDLYYDSLEISIVMAVLLIKLCIGVATMILTTLTTRALKRDAIS